MFGSCVASPYNLLGGFSSAPMFDVFLGTSSMSVALQSLSTISKAVRDWAIARTGGGRGRGRVVASHALVYEAACEHECLGEEAATSNKLYRKRLQ